MLSGEIMTEIEKRKERERSQLFLDYIEALNRRQKTLTDIYEKRMRGYYEQDGRQGYS